MLWRSKRSSIIISSELHEKIAGTCAPVHEVDSEVLGLRILSPDALEEPDLRACSGKDRQQKKLETADEEDVAFGYTRPWVCP